jgi:hypothetical protein
MMHEALILSARRQSSRTGMGLNRDACIRALLPERGSVSRSNLQFLNAAIELTSVLTGEIAAGL